MRRRSAITAPFQGSGLARSERVGYVGTFGETMFPSLRFGFMVVPRELSGSFDRAMSVSGQFAPTMLQA
jgi:GntR family transcriptional regulator/MocR family aminotransferase